MSPGGSGRPIPYRALAAAVFAAWILYEAVMYIVLWRGGRLAPLDLAGLAVKLALLAAALSSSLAGPDRLAATLSLWGLPAAALLRSTGVHLAYTWFPSTAAVLAGLGGLFLALTGRTDGTRGLLTLTAGLAAGVLLARDLTLHGYMAYRPCKPTPGALAAGLLSLAPSLAHRRLLPGLAGLGAPIACLALTRLLP